MIAVNPEQLTPIFVRFSIPREHQHPTVGQIVPILAFIGEMTTKPGHITLMDLFSTDDGPTITIYHPNNTISINQDFMSRIDTGVYQYHYNTTGATVGVYSAVFRALNSLDFIFFGLQVLLSKRVFLFNLR